MQKTSNNKHHFGIASNNIKPGWSRSTKNLTDTATGSDKGPLWNYAILLAILLVAEILTGIGASWARGILGVRSQNNMQKQFSRKF